MICNVLLEIANIIFSLFSKRLRTWITIIDRIFLYRKANEHGYFVKDCKFCLNIVRLLENIFPYLS